MEDPGTYVLILLNYWHDQRHEVVIIQQVILTILFGFDMVQILLAPAIQSIEYHQ